MSLNDLFSTIKGGPGSGNFNHGGIPGQRGGSAPGGGGGLSHYSDVENLPDRQKKVVNNTMKAFGNDVLSKLKPRNSADDTPMIDVKEGADSILNDAYSGNKESLIKKLNYIEEVKDYPMRDKVNSDLKRIMDSPGAFKPRLLKVFEDKGYLR